MLFHCSKNYIPKGEILRPTPHITRERPYVCMASSLSQAIYWAFIFSECRWTPPVRIFIYKVEVGGDQLVEDCRGHYAFEREGVKKMAWEVTPHDDLDGEVVTENPVQVVGLVGSLTITRELLDRFSESVTEEVKYENGSVLVFCEELVWLAWRGVVSQ